MASRALLAKVGGATPSEEDLAEWEAATGIKYPRVGLHRQKPVHPQYLLRPWFRLWWEAGGDHRALGLTLEGLEHFMRTELELYKDEGRGIKEGRIWRTDEQAWISELCGSKLENSKWGAGNSSCHVTQVY